MQVTVYNIISSDLAINQEDGVKLYDAIKGLSPNDLTVSFANIKYISTAFLNESIGKFALQNPTSINEVKFIYQEGNITLEYKIADVIENALMGDEYATLVDNALASL